MTFRVVMLGCEGGPRENNLSGYMVAPLDQSDWIALDAGSLLGGIDRAILRNGFNDVTFSDPSLTPSGEIFLHHLRAYLISHAHLDHIVGLVLNSQSDGQKSILGIPPTIDNLRDHIFNGKIWANFGNEGNEPVLNRYQYIRLPFHEKIAIPNTQMFVEAYLLSHPHDYPSTAFLIEYKGNYLLYFGDTSSDKVENVKHLEMVWRRVAPLVRENKLSGLLLECSYPNNGVDETLLGHLNPKLMMHELHHLSEIAGVSLKGLNVIVTHRKERLETGPDAKALIIKELAQANDLDLHLIFPHQGDKILL